MKPKTLPPTEVLRDAFDYNADTGLLTAKKRLAQRVPKGAVVGSLSQEGYLKVNFEGKSYPVHRIIWKIFYGVDPNIIDHINHIKTDNRIENLRSVSYSKNNLNRKAVKGYTQIRSGTFRVNVKGKDVGYFKTEEEAHSAYKQHREFLLGL